MKNILIIFLIIILSGCYKDPLITPQPVRIILSYDKNNSVDTTIVDINLDVNYKITTYNVINGNGGILLDTMAIPSRIIFGKHKKNNANYTLTVGNDIHYITNQWIYYVKKP